jgi:hypothetical protein
MDNKLDVFLLDFIIEATNKRYYPKIYQMLNGFMEVR